VPAAKNFNSSRAFGSNIKKKNLVNGRRLKPLSSGNPEIKQRIVISQPTTVISVENSADQYNFTFKQQSPIPEETLRFETSNCDGMRIQNTCEEPL
jgi:hypothetical protein